VFYVRTTAPIDRIGTYALWPMVALLGLTWLMGFIGPPPPSVTAIGVVGIIMSIYVPCDSHRKLRFGAQRTVKLFTSHRAGI
jgi:hypothetical protein